MSSKNTLNFSSSLAIGGGVMLGLGVGFFLFTIHVFYFVGSLMGGIGLGLIVAAILQRGKEKE